MYYICKPGDWSLAENCAATFEEAEKIVDERCKNSRFGGSILICKVEKMAQVSSKIEIIEGDKIGEILSDSIAKYKEEFQKGLDFVEGVE